MYVIIIRTMFIWSVKSLASVLCVITAETNTNVL